MMGFSSTKKMLMRTLMMMTAFLAALGRVLGGEAKPPYEVAEIYSGLREQALQLSDRDIPDLKGKPVWAVLVEMGYPEAAVTVLAVAEGTASLYISNGGGMLGLGEEANVRTKALELVAFAGTESQKLTKANTFPLPAPGEVRFYIVTPEGVLSASASEAQLEDRRHKFHDLFNQTHELITEMRLADQKRQEG